MYIYSNEVKIGEASSNADNDPIGQDFLELLGRKIFDSFVRITGETCFLRLKEYRNGVRQSAATSLNITNSLDGFHETLSYFVTDFERIGLQLFKTTARKNTYMCSKSSIDNSYTSLLELDLMMYGNISDDKPEDTHPLCDVRWEENPLAADLLVVASNHYEQLFKYFYSDYMLQPLSTIEIFGGVKIDRILL